MHVVVVDRILGNLVGSGYARSALTGTAVTEDEKEKASDWFVEKARSEGGKVFGGQVLPVDKATDYCTRLGGAAEASAEANQRVAAASSAALHQSPHHLQRRLPRYLRFRGRPQFTMDGFRRRDHELRQEMGGPGQEMQAPRHRLHRLHRPHRCPRPRRRRLHLQRRLHRCRCRHRIHCHSHRRQGIDDGLLPDRHIVRNMEGLPHLP